MMRKKSIIKDAVREISFNKKRFILLVLIITFGVGLYVGFNMAPLSMEKSAKNYYKENNLMDLKISSTTLFTQSDYGVIKEIENTKGVMMVKTVDAKATTGNDVFLVKAIGINKNKNENNDDYINRLILTSGTYPTTVNEGLVEESFLDKGGLKIGDLITLKIDNEEDLKAKKIKIVGTVKNVYYSSKDRDTATNQNQKNEYFVYLDERNFETNYYNEIYITINNKEKLDTYSSEYKDFINAYEQKVKDNLTPIINERHANMKTSLENTISSLENNLNSYYTLTLPEEYLNESIKQASDNLSEAKKALTNLGEPEIYTESRYESPSFYGYKLEVETINNISKVYPLVVLLIVALISAIWIAEIIQKEKVQIAMLRASGYDMASIFFKYLLYAILSSMLGCLIGGLIFYKAIPFIISLCYSTFYDIPNLTMELKWNDVLFASSFIIVVNFLTCIILFLQSITKTPAELMNQKKHTNKKNKLLKGINNLWKKLNFSNKLAFKNIFHYKIKTILSVILITCSSAFVLSTIVLHDKISSIAKNQYENIFKYDMLVSFENPNNETYESVLEEVNQNGQVEDGLIINKSVIEINNENVYLIVPQNNKKLNDYVSLKDKDNNKIITLGDDGVIISEKLAKLLNKKENDSIKLMMPNKKESKVKISKITKNYVDHYVYLSPVLYKSLTGEDASFNTILVNTKKDSNEKIVSSELSQLDNVKSVTTKSNEKENYENKISGFKNVTLMLITFSGGLFALVLIFIINNSIKRHSKEIIAFKTLGFYDKKITNYVFKENLVLIIIGTLIGLAFGSILTHYVIKGCEINTFMLDHNIGFLNYFISLLLIFVLLIILMVLVDYKIKKTKITNSRKNN